MTSVLCGIQALWCITVAVIHPYMDRSDRIEI